MKPKNRNQKRNSKQLDLSDDSNDETKPQNQGLVLTNFLRSRTNFKGRDHIQPPHEKSKPHVQPPSKHQKQKSHSFIDELTCLIDDQPLRMQHPVGSNNKSKNNKYKQHQSKVSKTHYSPIRSRNIQLNKSPQIKRRMNQYPRRKTNKTTNVSQSPKIHSDEYIQKIQSKNTRPQLLEKISQNIKHQSQIKSVNLAQRRYHYKNTEPSTKKHNKGIMFLYKRSTNQLLPVKRPDSQTYQQNSKQSSYKKPISDYKNHPNNTRQPLNINQQRIQSSQLYNLNRNSQQWAQDYIDSKPTSCLLSQGDLFDTVSPPSSIHSKAVGLQKNSKGKTIFQQLSTIENKFRRLLHHQNQFTADTNQNHLQNLVNLPRNSKQMQPIQQHDISSNQLPEQSKSNPNLQQNQQQVVGKRHLVQQNQHQIKTKQATDLARHKKQQHVLQSTTQLLSTLQQIQKQRQTGVAQPQSFINQLYLANTQTQSYLQKRYWSAEQDQLLLNFREQPKEYRLQMKCMLRYISIDKIMDRYLQLNLPIHEQSYQILQDMINTLA